MLKRLLGWFSRPKTQDFTAVAKLISELQSSVEEFEKLLADLPMTEVRLFDGRQAFWRESDGRLFIEAGVYSREDLRQWQT